MKKILTNKELKKLADERGSLLKLTQSIAVATNKSIAMEEALQIAIDEICKFMSWPVGHAYFYDKKENSLIPSKIWYFENTKKFVTFKKITEKTIFKPGTGLPGESFSKKNTVWMKNIQHNPNFPRSNSNLNIRTGLAIPILVQNNAYAVLEFFTDKILDSDQEILNNLFHIGTQLGKVVERKIFEDALKLAQEKLEEKVIQRTKELASSKESFDLCWEGIGDGMWDWNLKTNILLLSNGWKKSLGYEPHEIVNNFDSWESKVHPDDKAKVFKMLDKHFKARELYNPEYRMKMKSGQWRWFQSRGQALWDNNGTPFRMAGLFRDIHDRKIAQKDLEESRKIAEISKERLELCWKGAGDGMWDWNIKTNEVILSNRWRELLEYEPYEIENNFESWESKIHTDDKKWVFQMLDGHLKKKKPYKAEYRMKLKSGKWHWFQDRGQALWDKDGNAFRMAGSLRDINDYKIWQKELEESRKLAESASEAKSKFLANMSHEIRTPMNGIMGMTNLLLDTKINDQQKEYVNLILNSSEIMMQIINDTLDLSKIESGKVELEYKEFDLKKISHEIAILLEVAAQDKGLNLKIDYKNNIPQFVIGDSGRIRQILVNLINNAIKFTEDGEIKVIFEVKEETNNEVSFKISVSDHGIGIPTDKIDNVFDRFNQADLSSTRKFGGTGLGLAIAKELALMMGGDINVHSVEYEGSTFWLSLKLKLASNKFIKSSSISNLNKGCKKLTLPKTNILLVEDNPVNQKFMVYALKKYGCNVTAAHDGKECLDKFKEQKFDIILMDCQMPVMDGYEATGAIRELETKNKSIRIPIVAVTANALKTDRSKCLDAGMDDYISKPFTKETLEKALTKWT